MIIAFYKPFGVLSQFTHNGSSYSTLAAFGFPEHVYPVGRLDADSEGLLLLSDEPSLVKYLLEPRYAHPRQYWVQVEGIAQNDELRALERGISLRGYITKPCKTALLNDECVQSLPERVPPIRVRAAIPTSWISMELTEGKNRQVRKMTASVGLPTLRLVRVRIGAFRLPFFEVGVWRELTAKEHGEVLNTTF